MKVFLVLASLLCLSVLSKCQLKPEPKVIYLSEKYKDHNPNFEGYEVNKDLIKEIVMIAARDRNQKEIDSVVNISWNAISNPLKFDLLFPEFSKNTLGGAEATSQDGTIEKFEKPWLSEWTASDTDIQWAATALNNVLSYFNIMSYGDDCEGVQAAFSNIQQTEKLSLPMYTNNREVHAYLKTINVTVLNRLNKIALIEKDGFNILVCNKPDKNKLIKLLSKLEWTIYEP